MKSKLLIPMLVIVLAVGAYFIGTSFTRAPSTPTAPAVNNTATDDQEVVAAKPERKAEIYGKVTKMEGNLVTILQIDLSADPTAEMTTEEKQAYKQSLPEEERMALKEATQNATLDEVVVLIPVGIPMTKKLEIGPDAPDVVATLADISVGVVLSVWLDQGMSDRKVAEFVKVSTQTN